MSSGPSKAERDASNAAGGRALLAELERPARRKPPPFVPPGSAPPAPPPPRPTAPEAGEPPRDWFAKGPGDMVLDFSGEWSPAGCLRPRVQQEHAVTERSLHGVMTSKLCPHGLKPGTCGTCTTPDKRT